MIDAVPADGAVGRDAGPAILFNAILLIQSIIPPQTTSHTFNCGSLSEHHVWILDSLVWF